MSDPIRLQAVCEAILAVAREPVAPQVLAEVTGEEASVAEVETALETLRQRHEAEGSGLLVERVGGGWRLATRPQHEAALRQFLGMRSRSRLTQAGLEVLAIIAYRQPITLPEINFLRSVNSAGVIRTLLDRKLVAVAGRKQVVGTPLLYRTTREFLVHFGLPDLSSLPSLEEVEHVAGEGASAT
ncbi:MAG TPA: SMC-Scp complex subunit ScpB [Thermoanaerobaculaceae bacterium]|nr:SMC-Scp complex subunit ScpB [Thermoanaerobaculaceae bacterium]HPS78736.1 SMC-Scp complex subunit ScpB [Thermoanaerobaculaceae bacterium]